MVYDNRQKKFNSRGFNFPYTQCSPNRRNNMPQTSKPEQTNKPDGVGAAKAESTPDTAAVNPEGPSVQGASLKEPENMAAREDNLLPDEIDEADVISATCLRRTNSRMIPYGSKRALKPDYANGNCGTPVIQTPSDTSESLTAGLGDTNLPDQSVAGSVAEATKEHGGKTEALVDTADVSGCQVAAEGNETPDVINNVEQFKTIAAVEDVNHNENNRETSTDVVSSSDAQATEVVNELLQEVNSTNQSGGVSTEKNVSNDEIQAAEIQTAKEIAEVQTAKESEEAQTAKESEEAQTAKEIAEVQTAKESEEAQTAKESAEAQTAKESAEAQTAKESEEAQTAKESAETQTAKESAETQTAKESVEAQTAKGSTEVLNETNTVDQFEVVLTAENADEKHNGINTSAAVYPTTDIQVAEASIDSSKDMKAACTRTVSKNQDERKDSYYDTVSRKQDGFLHSFYMEESEEKPSLDGLYGRGLFHYKQWWYRNKVDISVNGKLICGVPIIADHNTLRVVDEKYSYFIPIEKIDYIRTPDGLEF